LIRKVEGEGGADPQDAVGEVEQRSAKKSTARARWAKNTKILQQWGTPPRKFKITKKQRNLNKRLRANIYLAKMRAATAAKNASKE